MAEQVGKADKEPLAEVKMRSPQREARGRGARAMGRAVGLIGLSSIIISSAVGASFPCPGRCADYNLRMALGGSCLRIRGGDAREGGRGNISSGVKERNKGAGKRRRVCYSGMNVSRQSAETEVEGEVKPVGTGIKGVEAKMDLVEKNIQDVLHEIRYEQDPTMKTALVRRLEQLGEKELILLRQSTGPHVPPIAWNESDARLDRMGFCNDDKYFRLDASYLQRDGELLLYCREAFKSQLCFLREKVVEQRAFGWIKGPPGTGKTTTTLAFCLSLDMREWSVTLIRLHISDDVDCIRIVGGRRRWCRIPKRSSWEGINRMLEEWQDYKKGLVVLDGFLRHESHHVDFLDACRKWLLADRENRRVVVATSMSSRGKSRLEDDNRVNLQQHTVVSWTEREYLKAVEWDVFYQRVACMLEEDESAASMGLKTWKKNRSRREKIKLKYYLAGGSCRFMFETPASLVKERLDEALSFCSNLEVVFSGIVGDSSPQAVNHLIACFKYNGESNWMPVSKYVATKLAEAAELDTLKRLFSRYGASNPTTRGLLFELFFFKKIKLGLSLRYRGSQEVRQWEGCPVITFDAKGGMQTLPAERTCLKPVNPLQGGYDAIIVEPRGKLVEFVQVTEADVHSFKLAFFAEALTGLGIPAAGWKVRVVFMVPQDRLESFRIGKIKGCGALEEYGWKGGQEERQAEVAGMDIA
ncbi:hypothetical protein GUITHDRAFT_115440 [Guillardia theta CCMP2712]|uniref:Uncharacterized protein n=1 Tax=Guillardia theta (strain CCMP2712) TaxID=905079 RepID=L1IQW6_GUITC|nr:hypothetical protein GUITHDRAFT_115440 [Guillardia theta CCMP2712]EKX38477.1 hypothetical protein GUITHDRAFT_115440 [Guillardia theta CCMP2712]|eukprot:XP_005825457.1 hypothetical protein GUITHDRAFT_115440 [Guillardia theta CCMP2712]